jgi:hypothetical protein
MSAVEPQLFRKRSVVIEAMQLGRTKESTNQILAWIGAYGAAAKRMHRTKPELGLVISTLEGEMQALPGDWIIRGVASEFYPCKPEIFDATYEPAEATNG